MAGTIKRKNRAYNKNAFWKPDPLPVDKYPIIVYIEINSVYKTAFLIVVYLGIYEYERKLWHPSWAQFMTFFIMFEYVLRHLPWQYIVWWSQKWKKECEEKEFW